MLSPPSPVRNASTVSLLTLGAMQLTPPLTLILTLTLTLLLTFEPARATFLGLFELFVQADELALRP